METDIKQEKALWCACWGKESGYWLFTKETSDWYQSSWFLKISSDGKILENWLSASSEGVSGGIWDSSFPLASSTLEQHNCLCLAQLTTVLIALQGPPRDSRRWWLLDWSELIKVADCRLCYDVLELKLQPEASRRCCKHQRSSRCSGGFLRLLDQGVPPRFNTAMQRV